MKFFRLLQETTIGRAVIAYFIDLPRWVLLNIAFAAALIPSLLAIIQGELALALVFSFPAALVLTWQIRLLSVTTDGRQPRWSMLWTDLRGYLVVLSAWVICVLAGLALLTPLYFVAVIPMLLVLLFAPVAICGSACLNVSFTQAWRNALVIAVHHPIIALGIVVFGGVMVWGVSISGGALIVALPTLWAAIAVYTVDDLINALLKQRNTQENIE